MELFFRLFEPGIPWQLAVSVILIAFITSCVMVRLCKDGRRKRVLMVWIAACLFLMLYSTVLGRMKVYGLRFMVYGDTEASVHLMPFWSIGAIQSGLIEVLYEKIYNIIFFVPYGLLNGLWFRVYGLWNSLKKSMTVGFLTSTAIELLQLITRTGTCETDDVICNTVGCAVGALIGAGICRMIGKLRNMEMKSRQKSRSCISDVLPATKIR